MSRWLAYPAHHTVAFRQAGIGLRPADDRAAPRYWLAPGEKDRVLDEPALPFVFNTHEIDEMRDPRLVAATHYGPETQEKASNEDFALTAVINVGDGRIYAFAALADGVTTRTFWAARAARIACFGAYRAIRALLMTGLEPGESRRLARIHTTVGRVIGRSLARDYANLERAGAVPGGWDPQTYRRYRRDLDLWYRSTLLFGLCGPEGGVIGHCGDGGMRGLIVDTPERAADPEERRIRHSVPGEPLASWISFGFDPNEISVGRINLDGRSATHLLLASDGVDTALAEFAPNEVAADGRCRSRWRDLPLGDRARAFTFLEALGRHPRVAEAPDNLSIARLSWPLPEAGAPWATWKQEPLARWPLSDAERVSAP